jgi:ribokinase
MSKIVVVGSINVDIVNRVKEYPVPGQTINSEGTEFFYGGKGANQAVAAARSGGNVSMVGAVGTDPFGKEVLGALQGQGVDTSNITAKPGATGMAFITVNAAGQNQIILAEGANGSLLPEDAQRLSILDTAKIILLQNEIPWKTNLSVLHMAKAKGIQVLFNPAPAIRIPDDVLQLIGTLILNESEAEYITGHPVNGKDDAVCAIRQLLDRGVNEAIITLGAQGSLYMNHRGDCTFTPAVPVKAVDTTSAGDTFIGYYAARICSGKPVEEALQYATAAAAFSVTRNGAQASIPGYEEVDQFIKTI